MIERFYGYTRTASPEILDVMNPDAGNVSKVFHAQKEFRKRRGEVRGS